MDQNKIKEAFQKAKADILSLQSEISSLKNAISQLRPQLNQTDTQPPSEEAWNLGSNRQTFNQNNSTNSQINTTNNLNELSDYSLEGQKSPNLVFSTGNKGVPTDKQTHQQTNRHTQFSSINRLSDTLSSLDEIKRTLRSQFKQLTNQEMLVFSTLYQLENEGFVVDYSILSTKLNLSESSIRDYIIKIIKKGIPLTKTKENNKKIYLSIPQDLRKLASLQTIISLREI